MNFRQSCICYLNLITNNGKLDRMKNQYNERTDELVVIFIKKDEIEKKRHEHYLISLDKIKTKFSQLTNINGLIETLYRYIEQSEKTNSLVFLMIYELGNIEVFVSL